MGVQAVLTECLNGYRYPKVYWLHNNEPDMINQTVPPFDKKFYNIYLAKSSNINIAPGVYVYLTTVNINYDSIPYFIDYEHPVLCTGGDTTAEVLRYEVTAVDGRGWQSVKSDFAQVIAASTQGDDNSVNVTDPVSFSLEQNYPNPFNPSTKINFSISVAGKVKLIVYNILGEEVTVLVNEYLQQGKYHAVFNAINLPAGVYFYVLEAPAFKQSRKMVLLK